MVNRDTVGALAVSFASVLEHEDDGSGRVVMLTAEIEAALAVFNDYLKKN